MFKAKTTSIRINFNKTIYENTNYFKLDINIYNNL